MISLVEARHYRCLRYVRQHMEPFHILVGPNASGKTTYLDVIAFLGKLVADGLDAAIGDRTSNFQDLTWLRSGHGFELAIEAVIPELLRERLAPRVFDSVRYEIALTSDPQTHEVWIEAEKVILMKREREAPAQRVLFPGLIDVPTTIITPTRRRPGDYLVVSKVPGGNDNFYSEVYGEKGKGWAPSFRLGPRKSALANLPEDERILPVSTWLKSLLAEGIQQIVLNSAVIRKASPPGYTRGFRTDGSNLPWVVNSLRERDRSRFRAWVEHVRTALPDIRDVRTVERKDDRHRYLILEYDGGLEVPSWVASDGTLRLLALTILAYLPDFTGVYLIEEPENGIHPRAAETVYQSLSSVYNAQILLATHSPVILKSARPAEVLCFAKASDGATDVVLGSDHPALREWQGETNLGTLFAAGVLG